LTNLPKRKSTLRTPAGAAGTEPEIATACPGEPCRNLTLLFIEQAFVTWEARVRVMGVDPGLTRCGLSVIESGRGRHVIALDVDVVRTPADEPLHRRLLTISDTVDHWMDTHLPDVVAIERVFANQNANTAMGTAQAGGVIALAAAKRNIDVHFHTPSEVKAAVTGNGRADKAQITAMVTKILGLQTKPTPADAADALALAICHCWRAPMIARMAEAEAKAAEQRKRYAAKVKAAR
jgi:crossover junction endodeoxyribonuclease RuvC